MADSSRLRGPAARLNSILVQVPERATPFANSSVPTMHTYRVDSDSLPQLALSQACHPTDHTPGCRPTPLLSQDCEDASYCTGRRQSHLLGLAAAPPLRDGLADLLPGVAAAPAGKLVTLALPGFDPLDAIVVERRLSPLPPATELLPPLDPPPLLNRLAAPVTSSLIIELYISESAW